MKTHTSSDDSVPLLQLPSRQTVNHPTPTYHHPETHHDVSVDNFDEGGHAAVPLHAPSLQLPVHRHLCVPRSEGGLWIAAQAWGILVIHLIYSTVFFFFMTCVLPGMTFWIGRGGGVDVPPDSSSQWYQSDMTTLISILVLVSRFLAGMWQVTTTWRCIFLLLETKSLSLSELQFVSTYKLPSPGTSVAFPRSALVWAVTVVMLLVLPAQLAAPIATGCVTWVPSYTLGSPKTSPAMLGSATGGFKWSWFRDYPNVRTFTIEEAAGLGNLESWLLQSGVGGDPAEQRALPARRPLLGFRNLRNGSRFEQVTLPVLHIHSFSWVDSQDLDASLRRVVTDNTGVLNISQPDNPLRITLEGVAAPLKMSPWLADSLDQNNLPTPTIFNGIKLVALQVKRNRTKTEGENTTCSTSPDQIFEKIPNITLLQNTEWNGNVACYAIASVNITAGSVECPSLGSDGASRCVLSRSSSAVEYHADEFGVGEVNPDPLIDQIFAMLPEVIALMVTTGGFTTGYAVQPASPARDPEIFLRNALTVGYQGAWSALTQRLSGDAHSARYTEPIPVVAPLINGIRMYIWWAMHLSLTIAGLCLWGLHRQSGRPVMVDHVLPLLFLDNSEVLKDDTSGLCSARVLTAPDKKVGRLAVRKGRQDVGHAQLLLQPTPVLDERR